MATAGTPKDENIENRPKDKLQPSLGASVASITLLSRDDSEDEEELDSEELEFFQTLVAQVEKPVQTNSNDK